MHAQSACEGPRLSITPVGERYTYSPSQDEFEDVKLFPMFTCFVTLLKPCIFNEYFILMKDQLLMET